MDDSGWSWDPTRHQWYRLDPTGQWLVFQDGQRIQISDSQASSQRMRATSTASSYTTSSGEPSSPEQITRGLANVSLGSVQYATSAGSSSNTPGITRNQFNILQDLSGQQTTFDKKFRKLGVKATVRVGATPKQYEHLDPKFKIRKPAKDFYRRGKVFRVLWPEPAGSTDQGSVYSSGAFNEPYHMKIKWFVVIREGATFCSCLPIATYGGQGVAKPKTVKEEHSVIYTGEEDPGVTEWERPGYGEEDLRPSIRVRPRSKTDSLDPMSRLNYAKVYTVEHNVKVYEFGDVHKDSVRQLVKNFKAIWKMDQDSGINEIEEEDEDDDDEAPKELTPQQQHVHNHYVTHYVTAYRNNGLDALANWLLHANFQDQAAHIKSAQEKTRQDQAGKGKRQ